MREAAIVSTACSELDPADIEDVIIGCGVPEGASPRSVRDFPFPSAARRSTGSANGDRLYNEWIDEYKPQLDCR